MKKNEKNYNIGLDIGTNSVGWAVVDDDNQLLTFKKRHMWGARLFDEAQTAEVRRKYRSNRRRMARRKERLNLLNQIMAEDINKVDNTFFMRLSQSSLLQEDRKQNNKYNLFISENYNDKNYNIEYPTIYHLRRKLVSSNEKMDIRLVYLAIHHIIKYRGNFLYEGENSFGTGTDVESVKNNFKNFFIFINKEFSFETLTDESDTIIPEDMQNEIIEKCINIIKDSKLVKKRKQEEIIKLFDVNLNIKSVIKEFLNLIIGYKGNISKVLNKEQDVKICLAQDLDPQIIDLIGDKIDIFEEIRSIYSWVTLQEIMQTDFLPDDLKSDKIKTISYSFISKYEKYKKDLKNLKDAYKKYASEKYKEMFQEEEKKGSYFNYNLGDKKSGGYEELYKKIKSDLSIPSMKNLNDIEKIEQKDIRYIEKEIFNETFLRKLNTRDNGAIPYQLHLKELEIILKNQEKYYSTILNNKENILKIMKFRIPYYVGPVKDDFKGKKFAWAVRKENMENVKVTPLNFEDVIDVNESAEIFIRKMTNKCTYLPTEDVLPKNSLIYSEYCLLNELNNMSLNDKPLFDKNSKNKIINEVFLKQNTVKEKKLIEWLKINQMIDMNPEKINIIKGYAKDREFASSLKPFRDFMRIFNCNVEQLNYRMIEELISWITIFEDKKILKDKISKKYKNIINEEQINLIVNLNYDGWGRLSKKLLVDVKTDYKGDKYSIMDIMRNTNKNFMRIITDDKFVFKKVIEDAMPKVENKKINHDFYIDNIEPLACSPAVKKGIWQSILIVNEITKIMQNKPNNIYIEFARSDEDKKRTNSRYDKLEKALSLLDDSGTVLQELKNDKKNKVNLDEKRLLYYMQNGKCLYTGESLNFDELYLYEVDHILPQCYIKDDSIENKALVKRKMNQRKLDSQLLDLPNKEQRIIEWNKLLKAGLMGNKKFANLTREEISNANLVGFINRQLVETRQIIKNVANILDNIYGDKTVKAVKAGVSVNFKEKFGIIKNRDVNNYHHAQDAYIACVVGEFIKRRYPNWGEKELNINDYRKIIYSSNVKSKAEIRKNMNKNNFGFVIEEMAKDKIVDKETGEVIWEKDKNIEQIKKNLSTFDCFVTRKLEENTSEFYNQNASSAKDAQKMKNPIPLKKGLNPSKYGAYTQEQKAYSVLFSYMKKDKKEYLLKSIPISKTKNIKNNNDLKEYFENQGYDNVNILKNKILMNQLIYKDKIPYLLSGDSEMKFRKELVLDYKANKIISESQEYLDDLDKNVSMIVLYSKLLRKDQSKINDEIKEKIETFKLKDELEQQKLVEKYLGFSNADLIYVYDLIAKKIKSEYNNKLGSELINRKQNFVLLEIKDKIDFNKLLLKLCLTGNRISFELIGGKKDQGRFSKINMNTNFLENVVFIDHSVTGMYEKRYMVHELENNCNK